MPSDRPSDASHRAPVEKPRGKEAAESQGPITGLLEEHRVSFIIPPNAGKILDIEIIVASEDRAATLAEKDDGRWGVVIKHPADRTGVLILAKLTW